MVIVDTSVWIDLFAGRDTPQVRILRQISAHQRIGVGDLMVCEVLQGVRDQRQYGRVRGVLRGLELLQIGGISIALAAAHNYRVLRQKGITIRGTIDCLIATFCIENGHVLLHNDHDFEPLEDHLGLQVLR